MDFEVEEVEKVEEVERKPPNFFDCW